MRVYFSDFHPVESSGVKGSASLVGGTTANDNNALVPDAPVFTISPGISRTFASGNVSLIATFTFPFSSDITHKNSIDLFEYRIYTSATNTVYDFVAGADPTNETRGYISTNLDAATFPFNFVVDRAANLYYSIAIRAVRVVSIATAASGFIYSSWATTSPFQPAANQNMVGNINGVAATTVTTAVANFNTRNDRDATAVVAPTLAGAGACIDHTLNADGSANISFEWIWGGSETSIDGFEVVIVGRTSSSAYTISTDATIERKFRYAPDSRVTFMYGTPANLYYTFYVRAFRIVDPDVAVGGVLFSTWVKSTVSGENPYQPSGSIAFSGDITGTIAGVATGTVTTAVANFNTRNDRDGSTVTAPTIPGAGACIDHTINTDGSADISFEWDWSGDNANIDYFEVIVRSSTSSAAYSIFTTPAQEVSYMVSPFKRAFFLSGVPANLYYTFGVRAVRVVDADVGALGQIRSSVAQSTVAGENPYRPSANVAFTGDISGTVGYAPVTYSIGTVVSYGMEWGGNAIDGQAFKYKFYHFKGNTDVSASATWVLDNTYQMNTTLSSSGLLTISDFDPIDSYVVVKSTYEGITYEHRLPFVAMPSPPPPQDGYNVAMAPQFGGSGINSATWNVYSGVLPVKSGATGAIELMVYLGFAAEAAGTIDFKFKVQRRTGGGGWVDVSTSPPYSSTYDDRFPVVNLGGTFLTFTGLVANTVYEFQILAQRFSGFTTGRLISKMFAGRGY